MLFLICLLVAIDLICCSLNVALPIVVILIPFIVDMVNGQDTMSDIIVQRAKMKDDIS